MGWLKKVGHKISNGAKKLTKSTSFKRGLGATLLTGDVVAGVAVGQISNAHNKHKASKKKQKNSVFENTCCNSNNTSSCGGTSKTSGCSGKTTNTSGCNKTNKPKECEQNMDCNMFMAFINNIFDKLLGLIEKLSGQQVVNNNYNNYNNYNYNDYRQKDYNTYNSYTSYHATNTYNDIDNILNNNLSVFNNNINHNVGKYNIIENNNIMTTYDA